MTDQGRPAPQDIGADRKGQAAEEGASSHHHDIEGISNTPLMRRALSALGGMVARREIDLATLQPDPEAPPDVQARSAARCRAAHGFSVLSDGESGQVRWQFLLEPGAEVRGLLEGHGYHKGSEPLCWVKAVDDESIREARGLTQRVYELLRVPGAARAF